MLLEFPLNQPTTATARLARLRVTNRQAPGITRTADGYVGPDGKPFTNATRVAALDALGVPPAWKDVWFCRDPRGHIQATGVDAKGRLQYRYHPDWVRVRAEFKFAGLGDFAASLPAVRDRVAHDIRLDGMPKDKALALVVRLMDLFHVRVGGDAYAKANAHYGLTTLQEGHVRFPRKGRHDAVLEFTGKSGKVWSLHVEDSELVALLRASKNIGESRKSKDLFRYLDESGNEHDVKAQQVNAYLKDATQVNTTAKEFRTWAASWKMAQRLAVITDASAGDLRDLGDRDGDPDLDDGPIFWKGITWKGASGLAKLAANERLGKDTERDRKAAMLAVLDTVAADLGNTRSVCRSSYVQPAFLSDWENRKFLRRWEAAIVGPPVPMLGLGESAALHYLRDRYGNS